MTPTTHAQETRIRGFGFTFNPETGACRNWYVGDDGIKRWLDNGQPVDLAMRQPGAGEG